MSPGPTPPPQRRARAWKAVRDAGDRWGPSVLLLGMAAVLVGSGWAWVARSTWWPNGDSVFHLMNLYSVENALAEGRWRPLPYAVYPPGFYLFTHPFFVVFGRGLESIALAQGVVAAALLGLVYAAGRALGGRGVGLVAAAAVFANLTIADAIRQVFLDLPSSLPAFFVLYALVRAPRLDQPRLLMLAGLALGATLIVRLGTLPLILPAVAFALVQALLPGRVLPLLVLPTAVLLGGVLAGHLQGARSELAPQLLRHLLPHASAIGRWGPAAGLGALVAGTGLVCVPAVRNRAPLRVLAAAVVLAGGLGAAGAAWLSQVIPELPEYARIALFTKNRHDPGTILPTLLRSLATTLVPLPIAVLSAVSMAVSLVLPSAAGARILTVAILGGTGFLFFATDYWTRYATPLVAPACVLAALGIGRVPVVRGVVVAALLVQGLSLSLGWAIGSRPGYAVDFYHRTPTLEQEPRPPQRWYGYASQTAPLLTVPLQREPHVASEWYAGLAARGWLTDCRSLRIVEPARSDGHGLIEMHIRALQARSGVDVAVFGAPPMGGGCAVVTLRDEGEEPLEMRSRKVLARARLVELGRFDVVGRTTVTWRSAP